MSILIKGAKMPSSCAACPCCDDDVDFCRAVKEFIPMLGKPKFCPLVEIPPHGDLIDRDKLKNDIPKTDADCFENCRDCTLLHQEDVWDIIDDVPTVIESEE